MVDFSSFPVLVHVHPTAVKIILRKRGVTFKSTVTRKSFKELSKSALELPRSPLQIRYRYSVP